MVTPTSVLAESSKSYPFLCSPEHIAGLRKYLMVCVRVCVHMCAHAFVLISFPSYTVDTALVIKWQTCVAVQLPGSFLAKEQMPTK